MQRRTRQIGHSFRQAQDGTVAIIFALTTLVLVLITGLAIDIGRVMHADAKLTAATDAAALAAARSLRVANLSDSEVQAIAQKFFEQNMAGSGGNYAVVKTFQVAVDRTTSSVRLTVDSDVPMVFAQVAGVEKISVPRSATAMYDTKDIELGLQLDVTGSMHGRKLADLKAAVGDLLDIMIPDGGTSNRVRIGLAPYSAGVNAGPYAAAVTGNRATDGCVYERRNLADQATDDPAFGAQALKARADLSGRGVQDCPSGATVQPLTGDKALLSRTVDDLRDGGSTAGHLGSAWAWYLVSPNWSSVWPTAAAPAPYRDGRTMKAVILMTDGIYNTIGGINGGDVSATARQSSQLAIDTCEAMKAAGITVYTVGFEAPSGAAATLRACASSNSKFFDASNGDELRAAFRAIATELNNLRLTR